MVTGVQVVTVATQTVVSSGLKFIFFSSINHALIVQKLTVEIKYKMMHINRGCPNEYWGVNFIQALLMWASDWCCSSY